MSLDSGPTLDRLLYSPSHEERDSAYDALEQSLAVGATVRPEADRVVAVLGSLLFAPQGHEPPADIGLAGRLFARLTLGYVDWLEVFGADVVGTRLRPRLHDGREGIAALVASPEPARAATGIWLATVAGFYDLFPPLVDDLQGSPLGPALTVAHAHEARRSRLRGPEQADAFQARCAALCERRLTDQGEGAWALGFAAAVGFVLSDAHFATVVALGERPWAFLNHVPRGVRLAAFPFAGGKPHALAEAAFERAYRSRGPIDEAGDVEDIARLGGRHESEEPRLPDHVPIDEHETNPYMLERPRASGESLVVLEGLDAVDWRSLEDAYGHGGAMPTFLRALASRDEGQRAWALDALFGGINHQGGTFSASVAALPFLVELACTPATRDRQGIVRLLIGLATGEPEWALLEHAHPTLCLEPLAAHVPRLAEILADDDCMLRALGVHLLGHLESAATAVVPALASRLEQEEDPYLRASLAMALARATRRSSTKAHLEVAARAVAAVAKESSLGAAVAAIAPFYERATLTEDERRALAALEESGAQAHPSYAWNRGQLAAHAHRVLRETMSDAEAVEAVERGARDCEAKAHALLFPRSAWRGDDLFLPEDCSELALRFLRACLKHSQAYYEPRWRDAGLPTSELWLARFVGEAPPGPLERRALVRRGEAGVRAPRAAEPPQHDVTWPLWKILHATTTGLLPVSEWRRVADGLDDDALVAVFDEATAWNRYNLANIRSATDQLDPASVARATAHRDRFYRALLDALPERRGTIATLRERAQTLLGEGAPNRTFLERTLTFAALGLEAAHEGTTLDARFCLLAAPGPFGWSPAMTLTGPLRWGLASLPVEARFAWFRGLRLVTLRRIEDARGVRHTASMHTGWEFLDLVPTDETEALLAEALVLVARHESGEVDPAPHERGLTRGSILAWAKDDELPRAALQRTAVAWGPRWHALRERIEPELSPKLRAALPRG
jgi:hypothetical protein